MTTRLPASFASAFSKCSCTVTALGWSCQPPYAVPSYAMASLKFRALGIEVTLQHELRGELIDLLFAVFATDIALDQYTLGLGSGETFVPLDYRQLRCQLQFGNECHSALGLLARRSVEAARHSDDQLAGLAFFCGFQHL